MSLISNTNITASQIVEVTRLIVLEFLKWSSQNLVCICHVIWRHLKGIHYTSFPAVMQTLASQIVEVITLILPECWNKSSCNIVFISCHLRPSQWCISDIIPISNINTAVSQILLFYWRHYAYILKFSFLLVSDTKITVNGK
jgi:hypothetical protein